MDRLYSHNHQSQIHKRGFPVFFLSHLNLYLAVFPSYSLFVCLCVCVFVCVFVCIFYFLSMNDLISAVQICHLTILYGSVFLSIPHTLRQWNINNQILTIQNTKNVALKNFHKSLFRIGERVQDLSAHPVVRSGGRNS